MKISKTIGAIVLITAGLFTASWVHAAGLGKNIGVRLVGTDNDYDGTALFDAFDISLPGGPISCFDLDLVDIKTGNVIGEASDCLSDITASGTDDGTMLTGTTFFFFPGGTVISQGLTTVQPLLHGSPSFTHITGAIPDSTDNGVIYGDGKFRNAEGPVRLSGAVNLSSWGGPETGTPISFDCMFILDLK